MPVRSALPAPPVAAAPGNFPNYAHPVTVIQAISAELPDPSLQMQARDEEIELLRAQVECFQQANFPEFVTSNSQISAPHSSSLGGTCMKHLLESLAKLTPECQVGVYCPECTELCSISVKTVIHHCQNCTKSYCLLCAHEHGCCLTCEADAKVCARMPELPSCSTDIDYTAAPLEQSISNAPSLVVEQPLQ